MNWISSHWLVLLFFLVFIVLTGHHAWVAKRRTRGLVDYYVDGRSMEASPSASPFLLPTRAPTVSWDILARPIPSECLGYFLLPVPLYFP
jgi:hypothetical protein